VWRRVRSSATWTNFWYEKPAPNPPPPPPPLIAAPRWYGWGCASREMELGQEGKGGDESETGKSGEKREKLHAHGAGQGPFHFHPGKFALTPLLR